MATLRDIAKLSNVSLGTASRVLSHDVTFKTTQETKEKIYAAAKELNYTFVGKPKKAVQYTIGCILAVTSEKYSDPFFTSILSSAEEEGIKYGMQITTIRNYNELKDPEVLKKICKQKLDGLIIMEDLPEEILTVLSKNIKHFVGIDPYQFCFNNVGLDHIDATFQVMDHLLNQGCKRIAYIGGGSSCSGIQNTKRMMAYREALLRANIPYDSTIIKDCNWDIDECAKCVDDLLNMENKPDAIFAGSDTLASVILGKLYEYKISCPKDIAVIGFNNLPTAAHLVPPLTSIEVPTKEIGKLAMKRLHELIITKDDLLTNISLPTKLIIRESTNHMEKNI
ncbi:MAG: LacI family DNA-binding transcriptional regulator [Erysipelotrichaceae bacterium]